MNNLLVTKELLGRQEKVPAVLLLVKTMKTRPSILWLTHQMSRKNGNYLVGSALRCEMINHQMITVGTSWYWVTMGWYWLVLGDTGSVEGGTGWYLVVVGQWRTVLVATWWYWVNMGRYWLLLGGTGSVFG